MDWILAIIAITVFLVLVFLSKRFDKHFDTLLIISALIAIAGVSSLMFWNIDSRMDDSTQTTVECKVVDRYYERRRYDTDEYLKLSWVDNDSTQTITALVSRNFYDNINVGDIVECKIWYDEYGIVKHEVIGDKW